MDRESGAPQRSAADRVREMFERFNSEPTGGLEADFDPEVEVLDLPHALGPERYRGIGEVERWIEETREVWDELRIEPEEVTELDDERCLAVTRLRGRARGSGIEVDQRQGCAFFLREGLISRIEMHPDREAAARALERPRG